MHLSRRLRWRSSLSAPQSFFFFLFSGLQWNTSVSTLNQPRIGDQRTFTADTARYLLFFFFVRLATTGGNVAFKCLHWRLVLLKSRSVNNWHARKHANQAPTHYLVLWVTVLKRLRYICFSLSFFFNGRLVCVNRCSQRVTLKPEE